jgi:uncharacterized protein YlaI
MKIHSVVFKLLKTDEWMDGKLMALHRVQTCLKTKSINFYKCPDIEEPVAKKKGLVSHCHFGIHKIEAVSSNNIYCNFSLILHKKFLAFKNIM